MILAISLFLSSGKLLYTFMVINILVVHICSRPLSGVNYSCSVLEQTTFQYFYQKCKC